MLVFFSKSNFVNIFKTNIIVNLRALLFDVGIFGEIGGERLRQTHG